MNETEPLRCPKCGHHFLFHDEDGQCWHLDDAGNEDCDCVMQRDGGWSDNAVHVVPLDDLIEHETPSHSFCPCGPIDEPVRRADGSIGWVYVHHSLDNREAAE